MKTTRSELRAIALDLLREHKGIKVRKTLRESRRMQSQRHMLLRRAMKQHMIQEGFFDSVKSMFGKAADAAGSFIDKFKSAKTSYAKAHNTFTQALRNLSDGRALPVASQRSPAEVLGNVFALTNAVCAAAVSNHDKYNKFFVEPQAKAMSAWIKQLESDEPWRGDESIYNVLGITRALQAANSNTKASDNNLGAMVQVLKAVERAMDRFETQWNSLMRQAKQRKKADYKSWQSLPAGDTKKWEEVYKEIEKAVKPALDMLKN